jgi:hypothetical protein
VALPAVPPPPGEEAATLQTILQALRAHGDRFDSRSPEPFCTGLLQDLFAGQAVEAVEPTFATSDNQDPRILKLTCPFDIKDNPREPGSWDSIAHFESARRCGQAPYRLYHVELDGNPANGSETVLYHTNTGATSTGYTWVDVPRCLIRSLRTVSVFPAPETVRTHLLVRYRGRSLVLLLITNAPEVTPARFSLYGRLFAGTQPAECAWTSGGK